jgi:hypothetical protein
MVDICKKAVNTLWMEFATDQSPIFEETALCTGEQIWAPLEPFLGGERNVRTNNKLLSNCVV